MLDLAEESTLADPTGPFRRTLRDGTVMDLSRYASEGVLLLYVDLSDGTRLFIDFDVA